MCKTLDPMLDVVFKLLFSRPDCEDLLISLLTAVLRPASPIESVVVLNPELEKETVRDRGVVLDLRIKLKDGFQVNVEMQARRHPGMRRRMLYHWARLYAFQLVKGTEYSALSRCACVFLLGYDELPSSRFHCTFQVLELHDHAPLTDQLELHVVQLRSLPSEHSAEQFEERPLVDWGKFFVAKNEHEELAMSDPVLHKAKKKLDELFADPEVQRIARDREEGALLYQFELGAAREEGREEGCEEGRDEGRVQGLVAGQRVILLDLVRARFPQAPLEGDLRIEDASSEQLTKWARQLLTAGSFDEWLEAIGR